MNQPVQQSKVFRESMPYLVMGIITLYSRGRLRGSGRQTSSRLMCH
jgi:hypothetical protein